MAQWHERLYSEEELISAYMAISCPSLLFSAASPCSSLVLLREAALSAAIEVHLIGNGLLADFDLRVKSYLFAEYGNPANPGTFTLTPKG